MKLRHVALGYSSERNADKFLADVLGLIKSGPKMLSRELSRSIFGADRDLGMINYTNDSIQVEVFIDAARSDPSGRVEHICFEVDDLPAFLERCGRAGIAINRIPREDYFLIFVRDADNNLFEIKEKQAAA